jgi:hypothetical protein
MQVPEQMASYEQCCLKNKHRFPVPSLPHSCFHFSPKNLLEEAEEP